ncbi:MAG: hypothetical protein KF729_03485 [Sandaracinaceae bacterium]|nr:hypothetical protein [Sandaracinaceae bacterium]
MSDAREDDLGELGELIARARRDGPGAERLGAVRARLESQVGSLDAPPLPSASGGAVAITLGVAALAALTIGLAGWLVVRGGAPADEAASEDAASEAEAPAAVPSTAPGPPASPVPRDPTTEAALDGLRAPAEVLPRPDARGDETADAPRAPRGARWARDARGAPPVGSAVADTSAPPAPSADARASTLREEIALLDRALRAREAGETARARAALEEHAARFPSGRLRPERERMLAELAAGGTPAP